MIAKAATISHGGNAVRYSVNKDNADIVLLNFLPEGLSAEAMYQRMVMKQKELAHLVNRGKPLKRNVIRMEISPTKEESAGWTLDDWARLANEYIRAFDSIDLSKRTKRAGAKSTNIAGSQHVAVLHRDSKSGILHLHIDANRIATDEHHSYHVVIPDEADEIIRRECTVPEDNPFATIKDVQRTALLLFAEYLDAATSMAASGGGGVSDTGGWGKDKDEDEREWARAR